MTLLIYGNAVVFLALLAGVFRRISPYSPFMLSALVWQVVFISGLLFYDMFFPLTERTFVMWLIWFLVSSAFYFFLSSLRQTPRKIVLRRLPVDYAFILVVLILWLAYQIWAVGNAGPTHFFMNLRASSNQAMYYESLGFVGRLYPWVFALFIFEHVNSRDGNRRLRLLLWCWMLLYAFATMGKLSILTPFLAWAVTKGIRRSLPMRNLFFLLPFLFGIMIMLHFLRTAEGERFVFSEFLSVYTYSPIVALGYTDTQTDALFGAHVFRFLYALMHAIGGGVEPVPVIQNYVTIPHPTNVYTVMQPFAVDFGLAGVFFGSAIYGVFFGLTYHLARGNRQLPLIIYSGLSVVLFGQFIGEFLFTMLSGHLQFVIASAIFTSESRSIDLDR